MESRINKINHNMVFIIWFIMGGLLSALSHYDFNELFSRSIPYFMTQPLEYYFEYSNNNKTIIFLFWFYLLSSPIALFLHCKLSILSNKFELPTLYISLFGAVFMLTLMSFVFLLRNTPIEFDTSGKMMRLLYSLITGSWWSTFFIYSLMWFVLFNSISSSINHYLHKINLTNSSSGTEPTP